MLAWTAPLLLSAPLLPPVLLPEDLQSRTEADAAFLDALKLFGLGFSWGGYESLALPVDTPSRTIRPLHLEGPLLRIHAGLECAQDLWADFSSGLDAAWACDGH